MSLCMAAEFKSGRRNLGDTCQDPEVERGSVPAEFVFGYDCGRWFKREGELFDCSDCSNVRLNAEGRIEKTFVLKKRQLDTAWNLVKVTRRGYGSTCELVEAKGRKPGFKLEVR